jgi:DMSO/TMAO reductase YedYZ molybdopterin-dependent catalytic subunit
MTLPPGQRRIDGFPRFGTHLQRPPPAVPEEPAIEVGDATTTTSTVPLTELAELPRREMTTDFHCVAGWSATGLRWEGVTFRDFFQSVIEPELPPGTSITHVVAGGLDGYRSVLAVEDALADDVLIADRLDGRPLDSDHGAPVRLVSPGQYGFISTKHLCRIEVHTSEPAEGSSGGSRLSPMRLLSLAFGGHPRARVWQEERHRFLPARAVRPVYRLLIRPIAALCARGSRRGPELRGDPRHQRAAGS